MPAALYVVVAGFAGSIFASRRKSRAYASHTFSHNIMKLWLSG